ncbi:phage tail protein [Pseudomonas oryzihabitans]|uniref:phage tail protein n=1 Tax=Pseudomonas oryzihabitans TaxID=47885 RepID=UPI002894E12F|nr:phage tail protein [Pseudomonas oryzihabitans]MDT3722900.1 phage tail protein [Pseudomonas oryzihabitans]
MSQTYYAILTAIGEATLANAAALNTTLKIAKMAVGDGGGVVPTPNRNQTALIGEWYRAGLNTLQVDPSNTSQIIAELVIPEATGGNWIREMGLIDADGNLIAVANTPPSYKPQLAEGSGRTQVLRMVLIVSSASAVELKIDPSVILATRQYVDDAISVNTVQATESFRGTARIATQNQANAGADDRTIITPKKLTAALSALIIQATESIRGIAKIATQEEMTTGADDTAYVTPKKLRIGFSVSLAPNGYVAFPSWLGGVIFQWGTAIGVGQATNATGMAGPTRTITLPLTFPNQIFTTFASMRFDTMTTASAFTPGCIPLSNAQISVQNNYTNSPGDIAWLAIGR